MTPPSKYRGSWRPVPRWIVALFLALSLTVGQFRFGGGHMGGVGGGADPEFGPTNGSQWVRDHAVPSAVSKPPGASDVSPGALTQALLNSAGVGAKFWLLAGTHTLTSGLVPLGTQQFWCQGGAIIDGANASGSFLLGDSHAQAWEVHGGTWQRCGNASSAYGSAVSALLMNGTGTNRVIEDATIIDNYNIGIHIGSNNLVVRRCKVNTNGRYGMAGGSGNSGGFFEHIEIAGNNYRLLDPGDDAGGTKFSSANSLTIQYVWCHNTALGYGLWCDWVATNTTVQESVSEDNPASGIFFERPDGGNLVYRNYVANNGTLAHDPSAGFFGACQIFIASGGAGTSPGDGVDISYNEIDSATRGIHIHNHDTYAPSVCKGIDVHHNLMWLRATSLPDGDGRVVGGADFKAVKVMHTEASNAWRSNTYKVASLSYEYWCWAVAGTGQDAKTWAEWQALGFDTDASGATRTLI